MPRFCSNHNSDNFHLQGELLLLNKKLPLPRIQFILCSESRQNKLPSECQCFCCEISSSLSGSFSLSAIQGSPHLTWQHESLRLSIGLLHTGNRCPGRSLANTRMFHILFWWLGNPWKPLTASGQSFFQRPFGAINLRSSMDS